MVLGSGVMRPLVTQLFFEGEPLNEQDRQLAAVADPAVRRQLVLAPVGLGRYRFDIRLQGSGETPFLSD
jgi:protocatechuate 3,4-dioxygenase beta subunit